MSIIDSSLRIIEFGRVITTAFVMKNYFNPSSTILLSFGMLLSNFRNLERLFSISHKIAAHDTIYLKTAVPYKPSKEKLNHISVQAAQVLDYFPFSNSASYYHVHEKRNHSRFAGSSLCPARHPAFESAIMRPAVKYCALRVL